MAFYEPVHVVGTKTEGTPFQHFGGDDGRVVEKIRVCYMEPSNHNGKVYIAGIKVWLTGNYSNKFGFVSTDTTYACTDFEFQPEERITKLSFWAEATPAAVAFDTSHGRSFATPTTGLTKAPVEVDVGSGGIFIGVRGRSAPLSVWLQQLGFVFLRPIALALVKNVHLRQPVRIKRFLLDVRCGTIAPAPSMSQTVTAQAGGLGWPFRINIHVDVQFEGGPDQLSHDSEFQPYYGNYQIVLDNGSLFDWGVTGNYFT